MRLVPAIFGLCLVIVAIAGCNSTRWNHLRTPENSTAAKPADGKIQSVSSLIDYLNDNASRLKTIQATSLDVTAAEDKQRINLRGKMVAEKPHGFRMSLDGPLGVTQVADLGSNNDEFWFWIKGPIGARRNRNTFAATTITDAASACCRFRSSRNGSWRRSAWVLTVRRKSTTWNTTTRICA